MNMETSCDYLMTRIGLEESHTIETISINYAKSNHKKLRVQ